MSLRLILISSEAAFERPDNVLAKINDIKGDVFSYQASVVAAVSSFRRDFDGEAIAYVEKYLDLTEGNIVGVYTSDAHLRTTLKSETESDCITNLLTFLEQIIELSGFAISNCVVDGMIENSNSSIDFSAALDEAGIKTASIGDVIIQAFIERNIFTQENEIIGRVEELFASDFQSLQLSFQFARSSEVERSFSSSNLA